MIPEVLFIILFAVFSVGISLADIKTGMVPRLVFVFAFPVFIVLGFAKEEPLSPGTAFSGALFGLFVFLLAFFLSGKKLGLADVWYSALSGLVLGPWWWYAAMFCACPAGIIFMLFSKRRQIPFIPFMAIGSITVCLIRHFF